MPTTSDNAQWKGALSAGAHHVGSSAVTSSRKGIGKLGLSQEPTRRAAAEAQLVRLAMPHRGELPALMALGQRDGLGTHASAAASQRRSLSEAVAVDLGKQSSQRNCTWRALKKP